MAVGLDKTIEDFFAGKSVQLSLFQHIRAYIETLDEVRIKVSKTQISFAAKRQFAWVWLPMEWDKRRPPDCLVLSFALTSQIADPQVVQAVEPTPGRWMHHVIIQTASDLNDAVRGWLRQASESDAAQDR
jgi:hypothetical protein